MREPITLDPRLNAFRADLADVSLSQLVKAERYVEPTLCQCTKGVLPLLAAPDAAAPRVSEVRYGEFVDLFERRDDGFFWVQNRNDRTTGYLQTDADAFHETIAALLNRVCVNRTFLYAAPEKTATVIDRLTLGSYVALTGEDGDFYALASGGYVFKKHVAPADEVFCADYVFTGGQLIGTPYLTGGRTPLGIDADGLVQLVLDIAGIEAPRFAPQQKEAYGEPMAMHWRDRAWHRGDLVFFDRNDHVGIMTCADHFLHASPTSMNVMVEPLADWVAQGYVITAAGRPA